MLAPLGTYTEDDANHGEAAMYLAKLARESTMAQAAWLDMADANQVLYVYGSPDYDDSESGPIVINDIQNSTLATGAKEPVKIDLKPVETGDPGEMLYVDQASGQLIDPAVASAMEAEAMAMQSSIFPEGQGAGGAPIPPPALPFSAYQVNDVLVKKVYKSVMDVYWKRSRMEMRVRRYRTWKKVDGWHFSILGFDYEKQRFEWRRLNVRQCYPDPTQEFIEDMDYFGVDEYLDLDYAKRKYPHLAEELEDKARQGRPESDYDQTTTPQRFDREFERRIAVLSTFWIRNQMRPMTAEEAVESGAVAVVQQPTGGVRPVLDETGAAIFDTSTGVAEAVTEPEMADVMVDPATGAEMVEGGEGWPQKSYVRQVQAIAGKIVDDRECEYWDIPILHDVNIPVSGSPAGIGDPFRLKKLQQADSEMVDSIVRHARQYRTAMRSLPASVHAVMEQTYGPAYQDEAHVIIVPDNVLQAFGGKLDFTNNPPPLPPALVNAHAIVRETQKEQSGYTNELRGIATNPDQSGRQTATLASNASGLSQFLGSGEEDMLWRLAMLMLHTLVNRLEPKDIKRIYSSLPDQVLIAVINKAREMEWDLDVEISSASGALNQVRRNESRMDVQMGAKSIQTYREENDINHEVEEQRLGEQAAKQMAMMPQAEPPQK